MNENNNRNVRDDERSVNGELTSLIDDRDLSRVVLSPEEQAYEEMIRQRIRARRRASERKRIKRNRTIALILVMVIVLIVCRSCYAAHRKKRDEQKVNTESSVAEKTSTKKENTDSNAETPAETVESKPEEPEHKIQQVDGLTFVDGILIVNKTYSVPEDYAPGINTAAQAAFDEMMNDALNDGVYLYINSGYRTYDEQYNLYYNYAYDRGVAEADKFSSRPGHSEHQAGLCFDVNSTENSFAGTTEAKWLAAHCSDYGFIIRFPKGKEKITGYEYEPWHIRFVGVELAKELTSKNLCLEEYLGVTSDYNLAKDPVSQEEMAEQLGVTVGDPNEVDETQEYEETDSGYYDNGGYSDNGYGY